MVKKELTTRGRGHTFYNQPPSELELPAGAPREAVCREFAKKLQAALDKKGWNQTDLAKAASKHMVSGKVTRDSVSNYVRGKNLPYPPALTAIAKALGLRSSNELIASRNLPSVDNEVPPIDVKDVGEGMAWLRINRAVSWDIAVQVLKLIQEG